MKKVLIVALLMHLVAVSLIAYAVTSTYTTHHIVSPTLSLQVKEAVAEIYAKGVYPTSTYEVRYAPYHTSVGIVSPILDGMLINSGYVYNLVDGEVLYSPNNTWHDCNYMYRLPVLIYVWESQSSIFIDFNITDTCFLGNLSNGSGVKVFMDEGKELMFTIVDSSTSYSVLRVYFDSLAPGFHYIYFYFGGPKKPTFIPITIENTGTEDLTNAVITVRVHSNDPFFIDSDGNYLYYMYTGGYEAYVKIPFIGASQTITIYEGVLGDETHLTYNVTLTPTFLSVTYDFQDGTTQGWEPSNTAGFTFNLVNDNGDYALHINEGSGGYGKQPNWYRYIDFPSSGNYTISVRVYATSGYSTTTNLVLHIDDASYAAFFSRIKTASGTYSLEFYVDAGTHKIGLAYHDGWSSDWNYDVKIYEVKIRGESAVSVSCALDNYASVSSTTSVGSIQEAPAACYVTETQSSTTTSGFYNWYGGGGGAPVPSSGSSESSGGESSNYVPPPPLTEAVTKERHSWIVSFIKSGPGVFFILLIILGLLLTFSSGGKGRKGRRRRR